MGGAANLAPAPLEGRLAALSDSFRRRFGRPPEATAEAPGRVNLIGEHLDYNEGPVLPVAIDRSVLVAFATRPDRDVRLYSTDFGQDSIFTLDEPIVRDEACSWANYVRGVVWTLIGEGHTGPGLDAAIAGNVAIGSGLSSSAALEVAALGALRAAWGLDLPDERLALLGQRAENEFVGIQCGIMDQFAATMAVAGHALLIDCRSLKRRAVPLSLGQHGLALVVADSAVPRRLERSDYNKRREECAEALRLLRRAMPSPPEALRDVGPPDLEGYGGCLPEALRRRVRHVVTETARVAASVDTLTRGDFDTLGRLMDASHASLRDDYEVSCPELDRLVEEARRVSGVLGARLTGAGFGGCTVNLVRETALPVLEAEVMERYRVETGLPGRMYACRAAGGLLLHPVTHSRPQ